MHQQKELDDLFLKRAERRGLLDVSQVGAVRQELRMRRDREPDLCAHEVAVQRGLIDVEAALAVLEALPEETLEDLRSRLLSSAGGVVSADTDRIPRAPDLPSDEAMSLGEEDFFDEVPLYVEALNPDGTAPDSGDSVTGEDLQMELPPPDSRSGDSLFDDSDMAQTSEFDEAYFQDYTPSLNPTKEEIDELIGDTGISRGLKRPRSAPSLEPALGSNTSLGADDLIDERIQITGADTHRYPGADTASDEEDMAPPPEFAMRGTKGAMDDFSAFGDSHHGDDPAPSPLEFNEDSEVISQLLSDSAVGEVMSQADDDYFGPPADLTHTPQEVLHDSIAPPVPLGESTIFDSESLKETLASRFRHEEDEEFVATVPPPPNKAQAVNADNGANDFRDTMELPLPGDSQFAETELDREPDDPQLAQTELDREPDPELTDVEDPEDFSEDSVTMHDDFPTDVTIVDDSEVSLIDITGEEPETGTASKTEYATGEGARPGLRNRTDSKLGVESGIPPEELEGSELTLADLRAQMGIGSGVKIGQHTARLKKLAGTKRRYSVVREIARGGMGKVIEVEDNDLRRPVALKVLRKEMLDRKDLVERFLEEAQITGQLEHPNIVPVHEIGVDGRGNLYFTMKLVQGEDLSSILKRLRKKDPGAQKAWPLNRLIDVFIKVCEGAAFAHSREVIHRDLKPANVMVGRFGEVQIMDWGVAKVVGRKEDPAARAVVTDRQDDDSARTMIGAVLGTPSYMPPEQARGEVDKMGPEADIFSLGVILYEMLCLKTPWPGKTSAEVLEQVKELEPELPSARAPDRKIPPELEALAMKCLVKDPAKRLRTAPELIENLKSWQEGRTLAAVEYSLGQLIGKWILRRKVALMTILGVIIALSVGGVVAFQAAKQNTIQSAYDEIAVAQELLAAAKSDYKGGNLDDARRDATDAGDKFRAAGFTLPNDQDAKDGQVDAMLLVAEIDRKVRDNEAEAIRDDQRKKYREEVADMAVKFDEGDRTFQHYEEYQKIFLQLKNTRLDEVEEAKEVVDQKLRSIDRWLEEYESDRRVAKDVEQIRGHVIDAETQLKDAPAALDPIDAYKKVVQTCESALAITLPSDNQEGQRLRTRAQTTKADAALASASLAIQAQKLDVAELWLDWARQTGQRTEEVEALNETYKLARAGQSRFAEFLITAKTELDRKDWTAAVTAIRHAQKEAQTSKFASDSDRAFLKDALHDALLAQVKERDAAARNKSAPEMREVLAAYQALIDDTEEFVDPVQKARAASERTDLSLHLGKVLYENAQIEQAKPSPRTALQLYGEAARHVKDVAVLEDIRKQSDILSEQLALSAIKVSDKVALLPKGEFLIGSNRESDGNQARTQLQSGNLIIDRYLVTNADFKANFVDKGGYTGGDWWSAEGLALLKQGKLVDATGKPGPAIWADGTFDSSLAKYPVTGISWYEAEAYARFNKKRLPTPEEWEIAGGAPTANGVAQSEYPFQRKESAADDIVAPREVGVTDWDASPINCRDMGSNVAEWTSERANGTAVVKGAEPGLHPRLFLRYARRAKNSYAKLADRSEGRGFRCIEDFVYDAKKDGDDKKN